MCQLFMFVAISRIWVMPCSFVTLWKTNSVFKLNKVNFFNCSIYKEMIEWKSLVLWRRFINKSLKILTSNSWMRPNKSNSDVWGAICKANAPWKKRVPLKRNPSRFDFEQKKITVFNDDLFTFNGSEMKGKKYETDSSVTTKNKTT